MDKCYSIINHDRPFGQMVELGKIVVLVKKKKNAFRDEKVRNATESLEKDLNLIRHEANQAQPKIKEQEKQFI